MAVRRSRPLEVNIRTYRPGDEAHIATIWNQALPRDRLAPDRLYARMLADPRFTPDGLIIAEEIGAPAGFLWTAVRGSTGWLVAFAVAPGQRRAGLGRALLTAGLSHLQARGCHEAICSSYSPAYIWPGPDVEAHADALRLLSALGFTAVEEVVAMECLLHNLPPLPTADRARLLGEGFTLTKMAPRWIVPTGVFIERHFSMDWAAAVRRAIRAGIPADHIRLAVRGDEVAGFALWGAYDDTPDRFGPFGVDAGLRGRGLGSVLLHDALDAMAQAGRRTAWFLWTEPEGPAYRVYRRAGFEVTRRFAIMRRHLPDGEPNGQNESL